MHKIWTRIRRWMSEIIAIDCLPDPLDTLSPRDWADLPTTHPARDRGCAC